MAKKQKLKDRLQKALLLQKSTKFTKALAQAGKPPPPQHNPADMTMRHRWSDGLETMIPYRGSRLQKVLVVGDGDLSFSVALAGILGEDAQIIASTYDSYEVLLEKYGEDTIRRNVSRLEELKATVLHSVDGTKLHQNKLLFKTSYSRLIFNYPHTGAGIKDRDRNIRAQQEMVKGFLESAGKLLMSSAKRSGKLVSRSVVMRNKDAPIIKRKKNKNMADASSDEDFSEDEGEEKPNTAFEPEIHVTVRTGDPYDDWKVKGLGAAILYLRSAESFRFEPEKYPGYRHVKTLGEGTLGEENGDEDNFLSKPAKTYVFRLQDQPSHENRPKPHEHNRRRG